jgi:uncharacterized surface protein with fasciclin (FAS1) repeats
MRLRKLIAGFVAGTALAGSLALATPASAAPSSGPTLADILAAQGPIGDGNWYDFDIINGVVGTILAEKPDSPLALAADPNPTVDGQPVKLTAFLPNDRAFQALAADLYGWRFWFASEGRVAKELLARLDVDTLETVVLYHVVAGATAIDSATALSVPKGTALTTVQGGDIRVTPIKALRTAILSDNDPNDFDPFLVRSKLDIHASNGIAHGISLVLRPVDL